ncbi:MAG: PQQ-binding-like beta-propeller repeat protein [Kiloniellales bacterium]|nr:PQQ-binding-like beta-propeller repeat protein [Kiloniellales bacterium]
MRQVAVRRVALAALGLAGLVLTAGCDTFLGQGETDKPLPGKRVSILAVDRGLSADRSIADLAVTLPPPYVNESWQQAGGSATHAMYHLQLGDAPKRQWSSDIGEGSSDDRHILAQPLVVNGAVYTMDARSRITAFDSESGRRLWRTEVELEDEDSGYFGGGLAYADGRLFVTTGFAMIYALDAESGQIVWQQRVTAPMRAAPTVSGGRVFATTLDNRTFALAADNGRRLWDHTGVQEIAGLLGGASPAVAGSVVVVPYSSGELYALLVDNGRELWSDVLSPVNRFDPVSNLAHIKGMPVIDRGLVLAVSHAGRTVAIDLRRGVRAWELEAGGVEMPWSAGDFIYLLTTESELVCIQRQSGRIRWVLPLPRFEDPEDLADPISWFGPVLAGDRLIVASSTGDAFSVSPYTGELLGHLDLPGTPTVAPVVANNTVYILTEDADLVAIR